MDNDAALLDIEQYDFSIDELSLLFLTNEGTGPLPQEYSNEKAFVLTTKETYIWGIVISRIVEKNQEANETAVITAFRKVIQNNKEYLQRYYSEVSFYPYDSYLNSMDHQFFFYRTISTMLKEFNVEFDAEELYKAQQKAFNSLVKRNYIEDPIFTSILGLSLAVVGFIPYGFTKQTKKGRTVHRKITALFWSYERKETTKDNITTKLNFRLWKILMAFKKALAETTDEEVG